MFLKISYMYTLKCNPIVNYQMNIEQTMVDNKIVSIVMNKYSKELSHQAYNVLFGLSNNSVMNGYGMFHNIPLKLYYVNNKRTFKIVYKEMIFNVSPNLESLFEKYVQNGNLLQVLRVDLYNKIKQTIESFGNYESQLLLYTINRYEVTPNPHRVISTVKFIKNSSDNEMYSSSDIQCIDISEYTKKINEDKNCTLQEVYQNKISIIF